MIKKIFVTLITIVACIVIGALVLNTLLPNVTTSLISAVEDSIYKATGMTFDLNGDGNKGTNDKTYDGSQQADKATTDGVGVDGF